MLITQLIHYHPDRLNETEMSIGLSMEPENSTGFESVVNGDIRLAKRFWRQAWW